jgi:hypothetical protein
MEFQTWRAYTLITLAYLMARDISYTMKVGEPCFILSQRRLLYNTTHAR